MKTEVLLEGLAFGEGPRWHDGRLWFSDMHDHWVLTLDSAGAVEKIVEVPNRPSGLGWRDDGTLLIVSMTDRKLLGWDGQQLREIADLHAVLDVAVVAHRAVVADRGLLADGGAGARLESLANRAAGIDNRAASQDGSVQGSPSSQTPGPGRLAQPSAVHVSIVQGSKSSQFGQGSTTPQASPTPSPSDFA